MNMGWYPDPLNRLERELPYDALAPAGITPDSTQREVQDANFALMERGLATPATRRAWDELRFPESRLYVDLFLHQLDLEAGRAFAAEMLSRSIEECGDALPVTELSELDLGALGEMGREFRDFVLEPMDLDFVSKLSPELLVSCSDSDDHLPGRTDETRRRDDEG